MVGLAHVDEHIAGEVGLYGSPQLSWQSKILIHDNKINQISFDHGNKE